MTGFQTLKQLEKYTLKHGRFKDGDVVKVHEEDKFYIYKDKKWTEIKAELKGSEVQMNLYDLNKQIMAQMEPYDIEKWEQAEIDIDNWEKEIQAKYYMLLCKENSYYTVFVDDGYEFHGLGAAVRECLEFVGDVVGIEITTGKVIEIWIREMEDSYCMYLFPYDEGVVSFKR